MKLSEKQKLLREILPGDDIADFERASLERGLADLRRQRRRGHLVRAGALAAVVGFISLGIVLKQHNPVRESAANLQLPPAPAPAVSDHVKFISDDELLALFPGRSVALIGKPGQQRLVFFDKPDDESNRAPF